MNTRIIIIILASLLVVVGVIVLLSQAGRDLPNVVIITLDTTRRGHLSCYGYERETSPNLDALAREGQLYDNAFTMTSWTLPSHASLFTGLYPMTHGAHYNESSDLSLNSALHDTPISKLFRANGLSRDAVTLAEVLKEEGYATGGVGGGPWLKPLFGLSQGFDDYDCDVASIAGRPAHEINARAIPFIRKNAERPFFLFLNYFDPHFPYEPPEAHRRRYFEAGWSNARPGRTDVRKKIALYDAEIFYMDEQIAQVFDELKRQGLWDKTWVIVTADHGEQFGRRNISGHGFALFEETIQVPLIIKPPKGSKAPGSADEIVQIVSLMPTILKHLDIEPQAPMDTRPMGEGENPIVAELYKNLGNLSVNSMGERKRFNRDLRAIYLKDYKLIVSTRQNDKDAGLFNLKDDPWESSNLIKERPEEAEVLKKALDEWKRNLTPPLDPLKIEDQAVDRKTKDQLKGLGY